MTEQGEFDDCSRACRMRGQHTLEYGRCGHADKPEPTVSMSKVFTASDGHPTIGYDQYTVQQLADLIEPALRRVRVRLGPNALTALQRGETVGLSGGEYADLAREAAYAIVHRNDDMTDCTQDAERYGAEAGCIECRRPSIAGHAIKPTLRCNWAMTRHEHVPHDWEPQPGMDPVYCPGWNWVSSVRAIAFREAADIADAAISLYEEDEESAVAAGAMEGIADRFRNMADRASRDSENCGRDLPIQTVRTDAEIIEAAREIGMAAPEDAPRIVAAAREFLAQSGVSTPGCDCGHDGMGSHWHLKSCAWAETLRVPHPDAVASKHPGMRGLLEHVGIDTTGRDIRVGDQVVDAWGESEERPE